MECLMFEVLKEHEICAWDFDLTLINHSASRVFLEYIKDNPYNQTHMIITMRSHGSEKMIIPYLRDMGYDISIFKKIVNIPDNIWNEEINVSMRNWKGQQCHINNCTILIDDMEGIDLSVMGCEKYEIPYIHPDDLIMNMVV